MDETPDERTGKGRWFTWWTPGHLIALCLALSVLFLVVVAGLLAIYVAVRSPEDALEVLAELRRIIWALLGGQGEGPEAPDGTR